MRTGGVPGGAVPRLCAMGVIQKCGVAGVGHRV